MLKIQGQTVEIWGETGLVTFNKTDMGWLLKCYDLTDRIWPCVCTFYVLGRGTWNYNDRKEDVSTVRDLHQKAVWGRPDDARVLRRKKS